MGKPNFANVKCLTPKTFYGCNDEFSFLNFFLKTVNCKTWQNIWFCDTTWGFEEHVIKKTIAVAKIIHFVNNQFGFKKLSCITTRQPLKMLLLNANVFGGGLLKSFESLMNLSQNETPVL